MGKQRQREAEMFAAETPEQQKTRPQAFKGVICKLWP